MPAIAVAPVTIKNVVFKVDADNYEKHVSAATFTPETSVVRWKGGTPDAAFSDTTTPVWALTLAYAQDWKTLKSLSQYLLTESGKSKAVELQLTGATGGKFAATVMITPGQFGGEVDTVATATVTLGVVGQPVFTPGT